MAATEKNKYGVVEGYLMYAKIAQSDKKYQSEDREYSVSIIVDEDVADAWDLKFKKQPAVKIKANEFEQTFKIPCPIENVKNVFQIRLKRDALQSGSELDYKYRPKVLLDTKEGRVDVTLSRLIANGSYGKVSYYISTNEFGTFARLQNILIDEENFKEYVLKGASGPGSEFGDPVPVTVEEEREEVTKARKDKTDKKEVVEEENSDSPF